MPTADQINVSVSLQHLASSLGIKARDLGIAELSIVHKKTRKAIAAQLGIAHRIVMDRLHVFSQFHKAARLEPEEAIKALRGGYDDDHYIPQSARTDRRVEAMTSAMADLRAQLERKQVVVDAIVEALIAHVGVYEPRPYTAPQRQGPGRPHYAMLELGDWQFGSRWSKEDTAGLSEISTPLLMERVRRLGRTVLRLTELQRTSADFPWLVINWLGDMVEGDVIFRGQGAYIDTPAADQLMQCFVAAEELLVSLLGSYDEIQCNTVTGNHGRMSPKKGEQHPRNNWDYLLYLYLAQRFRDEPRIKWRISTGPWMAYTLEHAPRFNHLIMHGDDIKSSLSIPFYGINRETYKLVTLANIPLHYVHLGHFHSPSALDNVYGEKIINGALTGPSPFSTGPLKTGSRPQQELFGFHPQWGKTWANHVYLGEMPEIQADDQGMFTPWSDGLPVAQQSD